MMNRISLLLVFALLFAAYSCSDSADKSSADTQEKKEEMSQFADDKSIQDKHELPEDIAYKGKGHMRIIPSVDGQDVNAYVVAPPRHNGKVLWVFHEWWGLNGHIKKEADRLFDSLENVLIIAPDMYDGKVATTREDAAEYMKSVTPERGNVIISSCMGFSGSGSDIATIGWSFGGGWSLKASIHIGGQGAGCVMYYGMPVPNAVDLAPLKADVLGIFAKEDKSITGAVVLNFEENCKLARKDLSVKTYDADHAFANPSSPLFNEAAATEANEEALRFLKEHLK